MATDEQSLRDHVLSRTTESLSKEFLQELHERIRRAYDEKFAEVSAERAVLTEQRLFKLNQDRCFRVEWELHAAAQAHGLPATAKPLAANKWPFVYVTSGRFGFTQSYVQRIGDLPHAARFRDELAEAARVPRLPLDDPKEIYEVRDFYALFAHNPVGRTFDADAQKLGALTFCVPSRDMRSWSVEIGIAELISLYPAIKKTSRSVAPKWKKSTKRGTGTE